MTTSNASTSQRASRFGLSARAVEILKRDWQDNRPSRRGVRLQDEFCGDEAAFISFQEHAARGDISILSRGQDSVGEDLAAKLQGMLGLRAGATSKDIVVAITADNYKRIAAELLLPASASLEDVREKAARLLSSGRPAGGNGNAGGDATIGEMRDVSALKRSWDQNKANERGVCLQDEFAGDYDAFVAYTQHAAAGDITICGGKRGA